MQQWNDLLNQNLPRGSSRTDVENFLDQHGIQHSYISKSSFVGETNSIVALVNNKDNHGFIRSGVQMKFKFDAGQRLMASECKEVFTGP